MNQEKALEYLSDFLTKYSDEIEQRGECIVKRNAPQRVTYRGYPVYRLMLQSKTEYSLDSDDIARHTCDNPYCFNPEHIIIGTRADNNHDRCHDKYFFKPTKDDLNRIFG